MVVTIRAVPSQACQAWAVPLSAPEGPHARPTSGRRSVAAAG